MLCQQALTSALHSKATTWATFLNYQIIDTADPTASGVGGELPGHAGAC